MKYTVSMKLDGRIDIEVEADSPKEAGEKANEVFSTADLDWNRMELVDNFPVNCYNEETGELTDLV